MSSSCLRAFSRLVLRTTFLVIGVVSLLSGGVVQADEYVTCESKNDRRSYCNVSGIRDANVELDRQLSKSPCIAEQTWGIDSRGVWVDGGCRAEFRVARRYGGGYGHGSWSGSKHKDLEYERQKLELERERLELEKEKAKHEAATSQAPDVCPAGFRPGRCEPRERKRGCKDMRTPRGLGCRTN